MIYNEKKTFTAFIAVSKEKEEETDRKIAFEESSRYSDVGVRKPKRFATGSRALRLGAGRAAATS